MKRRETSLAAIIVKDAMSPFFPLLIYIPDFSKEKKTLLFIYWKFGTMLSRGTLKPALYAPFTLDL